MHALWFSVKSPRPVVDKNELLPNPLFGSVMLELLTMEVLFATIVQTSPSGPLVNQPPLGTATAVSKSSMMLAVFSCSIVMCWLC